MRRSRLGPKSRGRTHHSAHGGLTGSSLSAIKFLPQLLLQYYMTLTQLSLRSHSALTQLSLSPHLTFTRL